MVVDATNRHREIGSQRHVETFLRPLEVPGNNVTCLLAMTVHSRPRLTELLSRKTTLEKNMSGADFSLHHIWIVIRCMKRAETNPYMQGASDDGDDDGGDGVVMVVVCWSYWC